MTCVCANILALFLFLHSLGNHINSKMIIVHRQHKDFDFQPTISVIVDSLTLELSQKRLNGYLIKMSGLIIGFVRDDSAFYFFHSFLLSHPS